MKPYAAFFCSNTANIDRVYGEERIARIREICSLYPEIITDKNYAAHPECMEHVEVIFTTWGMPVLTEEAINSMHSLRCIMYGAGSVKYFAKPYLERGITVVSAAYANGELVADFTLAQITLAAKGYFRTLKSNGYNNAEILPRIAPKGLFDIDIGIIGAGNIGRMVLAGLADKECRLHVYDPFMPEIDAAEFGADKMSLEQLFATCDIVSNHAPNIPSTERMLTGAMFESMPTGACFINTGRGATVCEEEMIEVLQHRRDITAFLDVTHPEPPAPDSPLLRMPNVFLSPHIAGTIGREVRHMADYIITQYRRIRAGELPDGLVTLEKFDQLA